MPNSEMFIVSTCECVYVLCVCGCVYKPMKGLGTVLTQDKSTQTGIYLVRGNPKDFNLLWLPETVRETV